MIFDYFEHVYLLNMDKDTNRMSSVSSRLSKLRISFERFSALVIPADFKLHEGGIKAGHFGCALSHYAILKDAWAKGYERFLIFEDDVILRDDTNERMKDIVVDLKVLDWDIFYLGAHIQSDKGFVTANVKRTNKAYQTHAYGIQRKAIERMLYVTDAILKHHRDVFDGYLDDTLVKLYAHPMLAIQQPNMSYTLGSFVNRIQQYYQWEDFIKNSAEMQSPSNQIAIANLFPKKS